MTRCDRPMRHRRGIVARALAGIAVACAVISAASQAVRGFDWRVHYEAGGGGFNFLSSPYLPTGQPYVQGQGFYGNSSYFYAELVLDANGTSTFNAQVIDLSGLYSTTDTYSGAGPITNTGEMTIYAGVTVDWSDVSGTPSWGFSTSVDGAWDSGSGYTEGGVTYFSDDALDYTVATYGTTTLWISGWTDWSSASRTILMDFEFVVPY